MEQRNLKFGASAFLDSMQAIKDKKELDVLKAEKAVHESVESFRSRAIAELEGMKKEAKEQADHFQEIRMETSQFCSRAMAQAYSNSVERLRNLK